MRFGFCLPNLVEEIQIEHLVKAAQQAEQAGFDSIWSFTDRIIVPKQYESRYTSIIEPLTILSFMAGKTEKVALGTSTLILPQRNPIVVAKQVADLDRLSKGRVILGVSAGWLEEEFKFLGADFGKRGQIFNESVRIIRALWSEDTVNFSGKFFKLQDARLLPRPVRRIPIWIAGNSDAAIRRAGRIGDGWHPSNVQPSRLREGASLIRKGNREVTISMRIGVEIQQKSPASAPPPESKPPKLSGTGSEITKQIEEYKMAGLEYLVVAFDAKGPSRLAEDISTFSATVMKSFG